MRRGALRMTWIYDGVKEERHPDVPREARPRRTHGVHPILSKQLHSEAFPLYTEKYFACGWWRTMAEVDCSGSSMSSSERPTPISSACNNSNSCFWSARLGQAG